MHTTETAGVCLVPGFMRLPGGDIESCVVSLTRALSCSERLLQEIHDIHIDTYVYTNTETQSCTERGKK